MAKKIFSKMNIIIGSILLFLLFSGIVIFMLIRPKIIYTLNDTKEYYVVTDVKGNAKEYTIESFVNGLPVREIGERAFENKSKLQSVIFKEDSQLNIIGRRAFTHNPNLKVFNLPSSVTVIGNNAFYNCIRLQEFNIEEDSLLKHISGSAFFNTNLLFIYLPSNLETIGTHAFFNNKNLMTITLPKNLKDIYQEAFYGCDNLTIIYDNTLDCRFHAGWDYNLVNFEIIRSSKDKLS